MPIIPGFGKRKPPPVEQQTGYIPNQAKPEPPKSWVETLLEEQAQEILKQVLDHEDEIRRHALEVKVLNAKRDTILGELDWMYRTPQAIRILTSIADHFKPSGG